MLEHAPRRSSRIVLAAALTLLLTTGSALADETVVEPPTLTVGSVSTLANPEGVVLRVVPLDAPEGPVDCLEARAIDPASGSAAGASFAQVCSFTAAPEVPNPDGLDEAALTLSVLAEHVRAALPATSAPEPASFPFAGRQVDGLRFTVALGDASAEVTAAAVPSGSSIVTLWYQRTAADSALFPVLNTFVDGVRLGAADAEPTE